MLHWNTNTHSTGRGTKVDKLKVNVVIQQSRGEISLVVVASQPVSMQTTIALADFFHYWNICVAVTLWKEGDMCVAREWAALTFCFSFCNIGLRLVWKKAQRAPRVINDAAKNNGTEGRRRDALTEPLAGMKGKRDRAVSWHIQPLRIFLSARLWFFIANKFRAGEESRA